MAALKSGDHVGVADALEAAFQILESEPHEEGPGGQPDEEEE